MVGGGGWIFVRVIIFYFELRCISIRVDIWQLNLNFFRKFIVFFFLWLLVWCSFQDIDVLIGQCLVFIIIKYVNIIFVLFDGYNNGYVIMLGYYGIFFNYVDCFNKWICDFGGIQGVLDRYFLDENGDFFFLGFLIWNCVNQDYLAMWKEIEE